MSLKDRIMKKLKKENTMTNEEEKIQEEFEVVINDIDTFALYLKNREKPYVLIRDNNFRMD